MTPSDRIKENSLNIEECKITILVILQTKELQEKETNR